MDTGNLWWQSNGLHREASRYPLEDPLLTHLRIAMHLALLANHYLYNPLYPSTPQWSATHARNIWSYRNPDLGSSQGTRGHNPKSMYRRRARPLPYNHIGRHTCRHHQVSWGNCCRNNLHLCLCSTVRLTLQKKGHTNIYLSRTSRSSVASCSRCSPTRASCSRCSPTVRGLPH